MERRWSGRAQRWKGEKVEGREGVWAEGWKDVRLMGYEGRRAEISLGGRADGWLVTRGGRPLDETLFCPGSEMDGR